MRYLRNTICAPQVSVGIMMAPVTYLKHITSAAVLLADLDVDTVSTLLYIPQVCQSRRVSHRPPI